MVLDHPLSRMMTASLSLSLQKWSSTICFDASSSREPIPTLLENAVNVPHVGFPERFV
jgi:hypothetical protein